MPAYSHRACKYNFDLWCFLWNVVQCTRERRWQIYENMIIGFVAVYFIYFVIIRFDVCVRPWARAWVTYTTIQWRDRHLEIDRNQSANLNALYRLSIWWVRFPVPSLIFLVSPNNFARTRPDPLPWSANKWSKSSIAADIFLLLWSIRRESSISPFISSNIWSVVFYMIILAIFSFLFFFSPHFHLFRSPLHTLPRHFIRLFLCFISVSN